MAPTSGATSSTGPDAPPPPPQPLTPGVVAAVVAGQFLLALLLVAVSVFITYMAARAGARRALRDAGIGDVDR